MRAARLMFVLGVCTSALLFASGWACADPRPYSLGVTSSLDAQGFEERSPRPVWPARATAFAEAGEGFTIAQSVTPEPSTAASPAVQERPGFFKRFINAYIDEFKPQPPSTEPV